LWKHKKPNAFEILMYKPRFSDEKAKEVRKIVGSASKKNIPGNGEEGSKEIQIVVNKDEISSIRR
jgi:hypothetical protein